jgi:hypothetical protein
VVYVLWSRVAVSLEVASPTTGTATALNGDMEKTDILEEICWGWARVDEQTTKYTMKCSVVIKDLGVCVCARQ